MQIVSTRGGTGEGLAVAVSAPALVGGREGVRLGDADGTGFAVQEALRNSKIDAIKMKYVFSDVFFIQRFLNAEMDSEISAGNATTGVDFQLGQGLEDYIIRMTATGMGNPHMRKNCLVVSYLAAAKNSFGTTTLWLKGRDSGVEI
jgi:hypothetical protein